MSYWTIFLQPTIQKSWQIVFQECLSLAHGLHNANFDWQWPVSHCLHMPVPARHSTAHRLLPFSQQVTAHAMDVLFPACAKLSLWQDITDWPSGPHPTLFLHRSNGQGIRLTINHHIVPRLRICGAWLSYVKGHVQLQFPLVSLWNRHMLTVLLTMQQRVDVWDFDFLWSSIIILL